MKKLLTILGVMMIGSSSVATLVSCTNNTITKQQLSDQDLTRYLQETAKIAYLSKTKGYDANYLFETFVAHQKSNGQNFKQIQEQLFTKQVVAQEIELKEGKKPDKSTSLPLDMLAKIIKMGSDKNTFLMIAKLIPAILPGFHLDGENGLGGMLEKLLTKDDINYFSASLGNEKYQNKTFQEAIDISLIKFVNAINKIIGVQTNKFDETETSASGLKDAALKSLVKNLNQFIQEKQPLNLTVLSNLKEIADIIDFVRLLLIYINVINKEKEPITWERLNGENGILNSPINSNEVDFKTILSGLGNNVKTQNLFKGLFWSQETYQTMNGLGDIGKFMENFDNENYDEKGFTPIFKALINAFIPGIGGYITGLLGIVSTNTPIGSETIAGLAQKFPDLVIGFLPSSIPKNFKEMLKRMMKYKQLFLQPWEFLWSADFIQALTEKESIKNHNILTAPLTELTGWTSIFQYQLSPTTSIQSIINKITTQTGNFKINFNNLQNVIKNIPELIKVIKNPKYPASNLGVNGNAFVKGSFFDGLFNTLADFQGFAGFIESIAHGKTTYQNEQNRLATEMLAAWKDVEVTKTFIADGYYVFNFNEPMQDKRSVSYVDGKSRLEKIKIKLNKVNHKNEILEINFDD
ncbi:Vmc-like lipoprotein signal peptide domain-containing protein [Williamsoniiplasma lucivorax]|uniref:MOLPALP family lipoprotein n=1 Tax=Williamsoniiplasma lucivorax TaxID=209274 RepID=A0A2S5RFS9_9MOLU|nr:hypothetical protein [Williamsoniiplasma lucivorax]PPE06147.1 hypothetical protein ELUCI_v1c04380 [Williamsoniiplasma lucivorax]